MQIQHLLKLGSVIETTDLVPLKDWENPLREDDVLVEATIVDIRYNPLLGTVGVLIDLRTGSSISEQVGNTAVIICRNVLDMQILELSTERGGVFVIGESKFSLQLNVGLQLDGMFYGNVHIRAKEVSVFVGNVADIGEVAWDASEEEKYSATVQNWQSEITVTAYSKQSVLPS
jgi:hypothetical protein